MRLLLSASALGLLAGACSAPVEQADQDVGEVQDIGQFDSHADIGDVGAAGSVAYDPAVGVYEISASGTNMWGVDDQFHYIWTQMSGDVMIAADVDFVGEGVDPHRKAGVMIRAGTAPDAPYADIVVHGDGLTSMQYRAMPGGETQEIVASITGADSVRLEKEGDYVYMSVREEGGDWITGGNYRLAFAEPFHVGLAVSAHNNDVVETARFSNVEITPMDLAPVTETGYAATVDSTLEILDVTSGNRRVVHVSEDKFEAPNWSRDGSFLVYNAGGKIYRIPVEGGGPVEINTGPYINNNNDHGISPDGTQLIISDQSAEDNQSRIYILPIEGSDTPREVVSHPSAPSYWHGWSPDGDMIVYTAQRPEVSPAYNLWAKRLSGGAEFRLTDSDGLDDGADFSPDGEWVWFNSTRSGAMQIWKVRPDGSEPTQVTFDGNYRDWFPHPSPDGENIIMVSFGLDVDLGDHPPNRDVWLRMMPTDGSEPPRIVAKLFGGQGTINVPSWSPDSTKVAFVSYRIDRDDRPE
ncbi:TolB family protein [Parvularcula flava]|uniref:TolB family protein n=1 Tax=Aquisalinus luteolus TaxID=1566827 RepID=A0A8J3A7F6_9PROT|nr:PD40 domain-containing protein [Aquisalinus luteolus]NHK27937.1 TolB family protein [Aquisalinus luteolus]GGH96981.1 hypothetical protein GCM10011355_17090 [Aquisalinus luteolus]